MALDAAAIRRDESLRRADRESLAEGDANDATASLSRCRVAGFFRLPMVLKQMERNRDLDSLRSCSNFQGTMLDLAFPADPFAR